MIVNSHPQKDGFRSCGEFEKHWGTIIIFPERSDIWRNNAFDAQNLIIKLANIIINYENVLFCIKPHLVNKVSNRLDTRIKVVELDYDDIWARDIAPNFVVKDNHISCVCWDFNSWGGIEEGAYFPWDKDATFAKNLSDCMQIPKYIVDDIVLEGGAIITDGCGTAITTKSVLLNKNRNPHKSIDVIEECIKNYFCVNKVVWLDEGLAFDETNGHIDNICNFVAPGEICLAWTDDLKNPHYDIVRDAYNILKKSVDANGNPFVIHKIPIPNLQFITKEEERQLTQSKSSTERVAGFPLVPSYINYYLINSALILPSFSCEWDSVVYKIMKEIFPTREIIQIDSREFLIGGGGFHCILHEIPFFE